MRTDKRVRLYFLGIGAALGAAAVAVVVARAASNTPAGIAYSGTLKNNGVNENSPHNFVFALYDATTSATLCTDTRTGLSVSQGRFAVANLFSSCSTSLDVLLATTDALVVRTTLDGQLLSPDQPLGTVPYAARARISENGAVAGTATALTKYVDASTLAASAVYEVAGKVGIGVTTPAQKLSVAGTVESTSGGYKFPDGTAQTTSQTGPVFSVYPSANNTSPQLVVGKLAFNTVEFDTDSAFDTTNARFKPQRAGYYRVSATLFFIMTAPGAFTLYVNLAKNGTVIKTVHQLINYTAGFEQSLTVDTIVPMNGSTDYLEVTYMSNSGAAVVQGGAGYTFFAGQFVHP